MAAKPKVHEIASAFGLDSKIALRMLKDDGEFVKGPSSSVEPAVARRLRALLTAEGHVDPEFVKVNEASVSLGG